MKRSSGYYRVKLNGGWVICEFNSEHNEWYVFGNERFFYDTDFDEINETVINPIP